MKSLSHVRLFTTSWTACSPSGSSIHGIFQARVLEWVASRLSFSLLPLHDVISPSILYQSPSFSLSLSLCVCFCLSHTHKHAAWLAIFSAHKKTILRVYEASLEAVVGSRMNNRTSALRKGIGWENKLSSCQCSFPGGCLRIPGQC